MIAEYIVRVSSRTFCAGAIVAADGHIVDCAPILRSIFRTADGRTLVKRARARGFAVSIFPCIPETREDPQHP